MSYRIVCSQEHLSEREAYRLTTTLAVSYALSCLQSISYASILDYGRNGALPDRPSLALSI